MKKSLLVATLAALAVVLPVASMAFNNPFTQMINQVAGPQASCPYPPESDPGFCACFTTAMTAGCESRGYPSVECKNVSWLKSQVRTIGVPLTCKKFSPVAQDQCVADLTYFLDHC